MQRGSSLLRAILEADHRVARPSRQGGEDREILAKALEVFRVLNGAVESVLPLERDRSHPHLAHEFVDALVQGRDLPIQLPEKVTVNISADNTVTVKGPLGELTQKVNPVITLEVKDNEVIVSRPNDEKENRSILIER